MTRPLPGLELRRCAATDADVARLLDYHHAQMVGQSPPGQAFALDLSAYDAPDLDLWGAYAGPTLVAVGAVRMLDADRAELKSMRTAPGFLRRGAARRMLDTLVDAARRKGARIVSLETGSGPNFAAAEGMYLAYGFRPGPAFGDYVGTDFTRFFHLPLRG